MIGGCQSKRKYVKGNENTYIKGKAANGDYYSLNPHTGISDDWAEEQIEFSTPDLDIEWSTYVNDRFNDKYSQKYAQEHYLGYLAMRMVDKDYELPGDRTEFWMKIWKDPEGY